MTDVAKAKIKGTIQLSIFPPLLSPLDLGPIEAVQTIQKVQIVQNFASLRGRYSLAKR
jgi:hypothetical protein